MRPEKLTLEGVYSYREKTVIDFSSLCSADLFGIFGKVGSGKSAILEAMTYCLYGKIERLPSPRLYYNMMNLNSDRMAIEFIFSHGGRRYLFSFETKRNRKDFNRIESPKRSGYVFSNDEWRPLFDRDGEVSAEDVLNLSYDNFRRTVIIPQGRFQEFLHLEGGQRRTMLMELFALDRFDLAENASALFNRNSRKKAETEGALSTLGDVSEELLETARAELGKTEERLAGLKEKHKELRKQLAFFEETGRLVEALETCKERLAKHMADSDAWKKKEEILEEYERCRNLFRADYLRLGDIRKEYAAAVQEEKDSSAAALKAAGDYEKAESAFASAGDRMEKAAEERKQIEWLELMSEAAAESAELEALEETLSAETARKEAAVSDAESMKSAAAGMEKELSGIEKGQPSVEEMNRLSVWFTAMEESSKRLDAFKRELEEPDQNPDERLSSVLAELSGEFISLGMGDIRLNNINDAETAVKEMEKKLQEEEKQILSFRLRQETAAEIARLAGSLEEGRPCPVCGARQHPEPASAETPEDGSAVLAEMISAGENIKMLLTSLRAAVAETKSGKAVYAERVRNYSEQIVTEEEKQKELLNRFGSSDFRPDEPERFREKYSEFLSSMDRLQELRAKLAEMKDKAELGAAAIKKADDKISDCKMQITALKSRSEGRLQNIDKNFIRDREGFSTGELLSERDRLSEMIEAAEKGYRAASDERDAASRNTERAAAEAELRCKRLDELEKAVKAAEHKLSEAMKVVGYESEQQLGEILGRNIDTEEERESIESYKSETAGLGAELNRLEKELAGRKYDAEKHAAASEEADTTEEMLEALTGEYFSLKNRFEENISRLEEKKRLEAELERISERGENIRLLRNMFIGKKFIDYAASVYLHELCASANNRFRKLTMEALRLELDEDNNFIVRDCLNGGKTRSVRTLSGGQTFQAAFSLSLALADSIGPERAGFFFMDEGFGSLDRESLSLVFESLKSLKKENRTVGIISHVEELKQEIDTYITVSREEQQGTRVSCSWTG